MNESGSATPRIRVALVEDVGPLRSDLIALLSSAEGVEFVAAASSGEEALANFPALAPDVVVMDIGLPGMTGVACVRELKAVMPDTEFMMLTVFEDHQQVFASLKAGATGYLVKTFASERLVESVRELHAGGSPMSSSIARHVVKALNHRTSEARPEDQLTVRELEILRALAAGQRYKEIAAEKFLSLHTVRSHIHRIYQKLQVETKLEATHRYKRMQQEDQENPPSSKR